MTAIPRILQLGLTHEVEFIAAAEALFAAEVRDFEPVRAVRPSVLRFFHDQKDTLTAHLDGTGNMRVRYIGVQEGLGEAFHCRGGQDTNTCGVLFWKNAQLMLATTGDTGEMPPCARVMSFVAVPARKAMSWNF